MTRENAAQKSARALQILEALDRHMPQATIELDYSTPLELLIAVLLSAQTTDKRVNLATPALFKRYRTAHDYAKASAEELEPYLKTLGLFRSKAKNVAALGRVLVEQYDGAVPTTRAQLAELPGVGLKTAGVVCIHLGGEPAFPVDTHIMRLSNRLGLTTAKDPDDVEAALQKLVPTAWWFKGHQLIIWHGRRVCDARQPACYDCVVSHLCPRKGVDKKFMQAPELRPGAKGR